MNHHSLVIEGRKDLRLQLPETTCYDDWLAKFFLLMDLKLWNIKWKLTAGLKMLCTTHQQANWFIIDDSLLSSWAGDENQPAKILILQILHEQLQWPHSALGSGIMISWCHGNSSVHSWFLTFFQISSLHFFLHRHLHWNMKCNRHVIGEM
jgi:hypothetical protein